jgi:hypothetical protein
VRTATPLTLRQLNRATLQRQGLIERQRGTPAEGIGRLAGLQAQHANMPYIALWSRLEGFERGALQRSLEERDVIRATVMRGTLHLLAADDFAVINATVTRARIAVWASIARNAGFDLTALQRALVDFCAEPRTVAEMEAHLDGLIPDADLAKHVPAGVRHVAFRIASSGGGLVHVPPSGFWGEHGRPRYVAARAWLGRRWREVDPDDATAEVIERYLRAYGPASLADIGRWLGQPRVTVLRAAVQRLGDRLMERTADDGRALLDLAGSQAPDADRDVSPRFLSRWDSVLISYDARDRILPPAHRAAVIKKNGDLLPTFLVDGFVAGLWTAMTTKAGTTLRLQPFGAVPTADRRALETEGERLARFIDPDGASVDVAWG